MLGDIIYKDKYTTQSVSKSQYGRKAWKSVAAITKKYY